MASVFQPNVFQHGVFQMFGNLLGSVGGSSGVVGAVGGSAAAVAGLGASGGYNDNCQSNPIDPRWTLAGPNPWTVTPNGSKYGFVATSVQDRMTQVFTDHGSTFEIRDHIKALSDGGGMVGILAATIGGSGVGYSPYNDGNTYLWNITNWQYASTAAWSGSIPPLTDFTLSLKRTGTSSWVGRYSTDGGATWLGTTDAMTFAPSIQQIGLARLYGSGGATIAGDLYSFIEIE